jgi:hypothetical protein
LIIGEAHKYISTLQRAEWQTALPFGDRLEAVGRAKEEGRGLKEENEGARFSSDQLSTFLVTCMNRLGSNLDDVIIATAKSRKRIRG